MSLLDLSQMRNAIMVAILIKTFKVISVLSEAIGNAELCKLRAYVMRPIIP